MGLRRGPWAAEEDKILLSYIQRNGHSNWRTLPHQAGLQRCGKSCRLRWLNYLRPDIKRGNFTREEEDSIIHLHQKLGNRWSAIAAQLPGRTDNEIKNVWHTHLKKRLASSWSWTMDQERPPNKFLRRDILQPMPSSPINPAAQPYSSSYNASAPSSSGNPVESPSSAVPNHPTSGPAGYQPEEMTKLQPTTQTSAISKLNFNADSNPSHRLGFQQFSQPKEDEEDVSYFWLKLLTQADRCHDRSSMQTVILS